MAADLKCVESWELPDHRALEYRDRKQFTDLQLKAFVLFRHDCYWTILYMHTIVKATSVYDMYLVDQMIHNMYLLDHVKMSFDLISHKLQSNQIFKYFTK